MQQTKLMPKVSIIVPVYNSEEYLTRCLESLVNQTYQNFEAICVNDGSTDSSLKILKYYSNRDSRIKVYDLETNYGPAKARNVALNNATGEYLMFVDSDDFLELTACEILVKVAQDKESDILVFAGNTFPYDEATPSWITQRLMSNQKDYLKFTPDILLYEPSSRPFLWLHFIKRSIFETEPQLRFNEALDLGEDQLMQFRYFPRAEKISFIYERLYNYRCTRKDSIMWKYNTMRYTKFRKHIQLVNAVFDDWSKTDLLTKYGNKLVTWSVSFLYYDLINFRFDVKCAFAKEIKELLLKIDTNIFLIDEWERSHYMEIMEWGSIDATFEDSINHIEEDKRQIFNEIMAIAHQKRFRIGRIFVSPCKRYRFKELNKKMNINKKA